MQQTVSNIQLLALGKTRIMYSAFMTINIEDAYKAMRRHETLDWGEVSERDWKSNNDAIKNGFRVISSYRDSEGTEFWIITEADRSATTILLPEDY